MCGAVNMESLDATAQLDVRDNAAKQKLGRSLIEMVSAYTQ